MKILLQAKEAGERPHPGALQYCSMEDQSLLQLWDQLVVEDGVLYHQYSNGDTSPSVILQLEVPQADRGRCMGEILVVTWESRKQCTK